MNKEKVLFNFNRSAKTYDAVAHVQKESAGHLASMVKDHFVLNNTSGVPQILDVGAGTGFVAEALYKEYPHAHFTLNDIAPAMLAGAQKKLGYIPSLSLNSDDAEIARFPGSPYDLIASNLALQWFENWQQGLLNLSSQTGCLAFSTLMDGTFEEWKKAYDDLGLPFSSPPYPSYKILHDFVHALKYGDIVTDQKTFTLSFVTPKEFLRYIKNLGANTPYSIYPLSNLKQILHTFTGSLSVSYKIFYCIMIQNKNSGR